MVFSALTDDQQKLIEIELDACIRRAVFRTDSDASDEDIAVARDALMCFARGEEPDVTSVEMHQLFGTMTVLKIIEELYVANEHGRFSVDVEKLING